ncbi:MAG: CDP-glycerol glycerophosphotransferase family protein, partial [bacterium]
RQGVLREKMVAVGNPLYDSFTPLATDRTSKIREFLGIPPKKPVILFGMQCFNKHNVLSLDDELKLAENLINLFKTIQDIDLIFKLHPDNNHDIYKENFIKWDLPENVHLVKDEFTPRELLAISSAFATVYSTMALESLVLEVPVITLDYTNVNCHLNLEPAAFSAKSEDDLVKLLKQDNWAGELKQKLDLHRDEILDRELANLGFASEKAAEEIMKLI